MTTQNDNGFATFAAAEALAIYRRVKLSSTTNRTVAYADAGEKAIGVTQAAAASTGDNVTVKLFTTPGTFKMVAKTAMATRNCAVYGASDGYVDDAASGGIIGYALDTASGVGAIIEVAPIADLPLTEADAVAKIDDDSGGTTGGTEQLTAITALTCLAAIDDNTGGTSGGTEQLDYLPAVGGTAAHSTIIRDNLHVLADEQNKLRVDVDMLRTRMLQANAVFSDQINGIVASLQGAGFMGT